MISSCVASFGRFFASKLGIRPLGPRVVIELDKKEEKVGGLYVPQTAQQQIHQGTVLAVGQGRYIEDKLIPCTVKVGQRVMLPQFGGQVVKLNNQEYTIIDEEMVLGILE
ncbi:10 kDa chaperonin [Tritrichomonas foetus]|uniref:20 kDa chaperonin, chloroplastic n=1 Tax=Tritrichomonas foetus TaxID=1144522 RepID=A0A1J4JN37_9EUKA|nr:10 kDa chaperonin [Tritrichomonas foetus]|eukprot:OHT00491.1 10 kDa chaperonin [Tritrichomonas foetus]